MGPRIDRRREVNRAPERPEDRRRHRDVVALFEVAQPEDHAEHHEARRAPTEILLEAVQHESPLYLLRSPPAIITTSANRIASEPCASQILQRVVRHVVQLR